MLFKVEFNATFFCLASGKKLSVAGKRAPNATLAKSQTLPRSMGSRSAPIQPVRPFNKLSSTPPAVKKQLSVPGNAGSPARKAALVGPNNNKSNSRGKSANLRGVDAKLAQCILDEIVEGGLQVQWEDIIGQDTAKQALQVNQCRPVPLTITNTYNCVF